MCADANDDLKTLQTNKFSRANTSHTARIEPMDVTDVHLDETDSENLPTIVEGVKYTALALADGTKILECGSFLECVWEFAEHTLQKGISVGNTPLVCAVSTEVTKDVQDLIWLTLSVASRERCDTQDWFTRMYARSLPSVTLTSEEILGRCVRDIPVKGAFLVTQWYTNQNTGVAVLGITRGGNAGVVRVFDCKARMEMKQGNSCMDESGNDEWHVHALTAVQYDACLEIWRTSKEYRTADVRAFCTEQDLITDEDAAHFWTVDRDEGCFHIFCDAAEDFLDSMDGMGMTGAERAYMWSLVENSSRVFQCQTHG
jgi:hypothetical protein